MISLNPYTYIAGAVVLASIGGTFYYQNNQIHSYHVQLEAANSTIAVRDQRIKELTDASNQQFAKSGENIIKVIQGPKEVQSIIEKVNTTPDSTACEQPKFSSEINNAF